MLLTFLVYFKNETKRVIVKLLRNSLNVKSNSDKLCKCREGEVVLAVNGRLQFVTRNEIYYRGAREGPGGVR